MSLVLDIKILQLLKLVIQTLINSLYVNMYNVLYNVCVYIYYTNDLSQNIKICTIIWPHFSY